MTAVSNPLFALPVVYTEISYASGLFPAQRPESPSGQSTRSRRSNGSSSDDEPVQGWDGFTELALRAGGPNLCDPPCATFLQLPRNNPNTQALRDPHRRLEYGVMDIARRNGVDVSEVKFCGRRPVHHPDQEPRLTALICANRHDFGSRWIDAARRIRAYLHQEGINNIAVEILDSRYEQRLTLFPCFRSDAIYPVWNKVVERLLHSINMKGILTIGCYRVGSSDNANECQPTVVIGVNHLVRRDWNTAREQFVRVLESSGLPTISVYIRQEALFPSADTGLASWNPATRSDPNHEGIRPGRSLSSEIIEHGKGTFGGWVELRHPLSGRWISFGITCSHCVLPELKRVSLEELPVVQEWRRKGIRADDQKLPHLRRIEVPSRHELLADIKALKQSIEENKKFPDYQEVEEAKRSGKFALPFKEKRWNSICVVLKSKEENLKKYEKIIEDQRHHFGQVSAASGLREQPLQTTSNARELPSILDWALVRPNRHAKGSSNLLPYPPDNSYQALVLGDFRCSAIEPDEMLYKLGQATGLTYGIYGGLVEVHIATRVVRGQEAYLPTFEHSVLTRHGERATVIEGDSGSLFFNKLGHVVGICFGGVRNGDRGFFTHSADLVQSILMMTGAQAVRIMPGEI